MVDERLVDVGLDEGRVVATRPDQLADPADPAGVRVVVEELLPGGNDPGRVRSERLANGLDETYQSPIRR